MISKEGSADAPGEPRVGRDALRRDAWRAALGILVLLAAVKHLAAAVPAVSGFAFTVAAAAQLYYPLTRVGQNGVTRESLGLRLDAWRADLRDLLVAAVLTGVPYALIFHLWQRQMGRSFELAWPSGFLERVLVELLVIALAEELFFRGFLQERLERLFPARRRLFGAPFGAAVIGASLVFALAHFVGEYNPSRFGPFFPSLVFGLLFARRGTLLAPVGFHAFCNLLADVLFASHR